MNILKGFLNFLGIILAVILSISLLVSLIVTPVISSATNVLTPKTLQKILSSIDYKEILAESDSDVELDEENTGIPANTLQSLMSSETAKDIIELYTHDVTTTLTGENEEKKFTPEAIKDIINENIDEIGDIAYDLAQEENSEITKEEIKAEILKDVDKSAEELSKFLPDAEELINTNSMDEATLDALKTLATGSFKTFIFSTVIVLSLLIFGCRFVRFKGFIWLAVVYILGAITSFAARAVANTLWKEVIADSLPFSPDIIAPAVSIALSQFVITGIVLLVLAVAFITAFVLIKKYQRKKQMAVYASDSPFSTLLESFPETSEEVAETLEETTEAEETVSDTTQD